MLSCACPHCGSRIRIALHVPWGRCASCGRQGPLPPEVMEAVAAASAIVQQGTARERQIQGSLRTVVAHGRSYGARTAGLGALVLVPMGLFTAVMSLGAGLSADDAGVAFLIPTFVLSFVVALAVVALAVRQVTTKQRAMERAFSALPPAAPGEAAACHVCGADIAAGAEGVVRCAYCATDNIVTPAALAAIAVTRSTSFATLDQSAKARLAELRGATFSAAAISALGAFVVPVGIFLCAIVIAAIYSLQRHPADPAVVYVIVKEGGRDCVGILKPVDGKPSVVFGSSRRPGLPSSRQLAQGEGAVTFHAADFIGRHLEGAKHEGIVKAVISDLINGNAAVVAHDKSLPLHGSCVAEP